MTIYNTQQLISKNESSKQITDFNSTESKVLNLELNITIE